MEPFFDVDGITIYCADNADVEWPTPDEVGLLLTDPPYGINWDTDYSRFPGVSPSGKYHNGGRSYIAVGGDDRPFDPARLLAYGRIAVFGANHFAPLLPLGGRWVVWRKRGSSPLLAEAELMWHNCGGRAVDYFETTRNEARQLDGFLHPTQKPVSLMRWVLGKWTEPGDLVFDPYMGSGPVARACADLGRRYIGIELVEEYCQAAVNRLGQTALVFE